MMMPSPPVTVIDVASGINSTTANTTSGSRASLSLSPPRNRGRDKEPLPTTDGGDAMEPLLLSSSNPAGVSGTSQTRRSRVPRCLSRVRQSRLVASVIAIFSFSGGVTWIVRGICICVGMMLMGGVGSFTLHQMMSPQIESLLRQRNEMQQDIEELRNQVANMTRIAATRLDMIHLLEKELEKQVVAAAAATPRGHLGNAGGGENGHVRTRHFNAHAVQSNFWTTLVYAALLGLLVLAVVGFRIYQIARAETQRAQKSRPSAGFHASPSTGSAYYENGLLASAATSGGASDATNTAATTQLYKRAPGNAPGDRLVHV